MRYTRQFDSIAELDEFVAFHKAENGMEFSFDRISRKAWIETAEETAEELSEAEREEGISSAARALGRLGGSKSSPAKTASARANAKKPRPRKKTA